MIYKRLPQFLTFLNFRGVFPRLGGSFRGSVSPHSLRSGAARFRAPSQSPTHPVRARSASLAALGRAVCVFAALVLRPRPTGSAAASCRRPGACLRRLASRAPLIVLTHRCCKLEFTITLLCYSEYVKLGQIFSVNLPLAWHRRSFSLLAPW